MDHHVNLHAARACRVVCPVSPVSWHKTAVGRGTNPLTRLRPRPGSLSIGSAPLKHLRVPTRIQSSCQSRLPASELGRGFQN